MILLMIQQPPAARKNRLKRLQTNLCFHRQTYQMVSFIGSNTAIYSLISSHMYITQVFSKTMLGVFKRSFQTYFSYCRVPPFFQTSNSSRVERIFFP